MKIPFPKMSVGIYINYFMWGMAGLMIGAHMQVLADNLGVTVAKISFLMAALGIGKLFALAIAGVLSDKFGRKPFSVLASFVLVIAMVGLPLAPNYPLAFIFAMLIGIGNSCLDAGSYAALIEAYKEKASSATVFVKAVIAVGGILMPMMIAYLATNGMFFGYTFFFVAAVYLVNGLFLTTAKFPDYKAAAQATETGTSAGAPKAKFFQEGIALIVIGFTSSGLLSIMNTWIPKFGTEVLKLDATKAVQLVSWYSIGSLASVILLALLLNKVIKPITIMIVYPLLTIVSVLTIIYVQTPAVSIFAAALVGFSVSGVLQLGLAIIAEFFPARKGTITSTLNIAGGVAFIVIPLVTGVMSGSVGITPIFFLAIGIAVVGILLAILVAYRYKKVFGNQGNTTHAKVS